MVSFEDFLAQDFYGFLVSKNLTCPHHNKCYFEHTLICIALQNKLIFTSTLPIFVKLLEIFSFSFMFLLSNLFLYIYLSVILHF